MKDKEIAVIAIWPTKIDGYTYPKHDVQYLIRCEAVEYMTLDETRGAVTFVLRSGAKIEASASETADCAFAVFGVDFVE
jgi:hypothetical protein